MKLIKLFFAVVISILLFLAGCGGGGGGGSSSGDSGGGAGTISLAWDANTDPAVAGYRVYYGTTSKNYLSAVDVGNVTNCTLKNLATGQKYFMAVTAYATSHEESDFSDEVSGTAR